MSNLMSTAVKLFSSNRLATGISRTFLKTGTKVEISKVGNELQKTVTKTNGNQFISMFSKDGKTLLGRSQITPRGKICYSYGAQNYDKLIQAQVNDGTFFNFLGHRNRNNGILYTNVTGKYGASNKFMPQFKMAMDYIRGLASKTQYQVSKISAKW